MVSLRPTPAATVLLVGNLLDAVFTLTLLELHAAREMNPLLKWAYEASPLAFVLAKLSMVQLSLLLPLRLAGPVAAALVVRGGAALYTSVVGYQIVLLATLAPLL
jgi:hypothetical protein